MLTFVTLNNLSLTGPGFLLVNQKRISLLANILMESSTASSQSDLR